MASAATILLRAFYARSVHDVARDLLGRLLVHMRPCRGGEVARLSGRIVEVEAYDGESDLACHASRGRTKRTEVMFGEAGHAYVYFVYGMHVCLNVVTGPVGYPAAVLIRALEPVEGIKMMPSGRAGPAQIASGPGRLTRSLGIEMSLNGADLCSGETLFLEAGDPVPDKAVLRGPRVGVDYAGPWSAKPWRLGVSRSASLSRPFGPSR